MKRWRLTHGDERGETVPVRRTRGLAVVAGLLLAVPLTLAAGPATAGTATGSKAGSATGSTAGSAAGSTAETVAGTAVGITETRHFRGEGDSSFGFAYYYARADARQQATEAGFTDCVETDGYTSPDGFWAWVLLECAR